MKQFLVKAKRVITSPSMLFVYFGLLLLLILLVYGIQQTAGAENPIFGISTMRTLGRVIIYCIAAMGFTILLGYAGLASLGTAGFLAVGIYLTQLFCNKLGWNFILAIIVCLVIAVVLGVIIGFISLRIEGMYLAIITLCVSAIIIEVIKIIWGLDAISMGYLQFLKPFGVELNRTQYLYAMYILIVVFFVLVAILTRNITKSQTGRAMLAMKNSESAAKAMGASVLKYRIFAFVFATCCAVLAGCLFAGYIRAADYTNWNLSFSLELLAAVIVGGASSLWGIVAGCFIIFGVDGLILQKIDFFTANPDFKYLLNGVLIIIVVMFYPGGITQAIWQIKAKIKMAKAKKAQSKKVIGNEKS